VKVGDTDGYDKPRAYMVPASVWKKGSNVVAIRVSDGGGGGGLWGRPDSLIVTEASGKVLPLAGPWHYRVEINASSAGLTFSQPGELATYLSQHFGPRAVVATSTTAGAARSASITVLELSVVPQNLAFDRTELSVRAGAEVELVLKNPDQMQHNAVIGRPGSFERLGAAADALARSPNGAERGYVPSGSDVVAATRLADPGETVRVRFKAPAAVGEYPFVCTFPGHWRVMRGVLKVTAR
jgi:azurin